MSDSPNRVRVTPILLGLSLLLAVASSGCVVHHHVDSRTPPRSAKHGHVHHRGDTTLVFDSSWHGYWIKGRPHHYFHGNRYYRLHRGRWQAAPRVRGPWAWVAVTTLPPGLHHHHSARNERREERREAAQDRREEHREAATDRREERREVAKERREERREVARENREERRENRAERGQVAQERQEDRRQAKQAPA